MVFLPFYLPHSSLFRKPYLGLGAAVLWVGAQVCVCASSLDLEPLIFLVLFSDTVNFDQWR